MTVLRVAVHVRPGAERTRVGGCHDGRLVVAVMARAVDGPATLAVTKAVAVAFETRPQDVVLVSGAMSSTKVLDVEGGTLDKLVQLLSRD